MSTIKGKRTIPEETVTAFTKAEEQLSCFLKEVQDALEKRIPTGR